MRAENSIRKVRYAASGGRSALNTDQIARLLRIEQLVMAICGGSVEEGDFRSDESDTCFGCGNRKAHTPTCPVVELVALMGETND